MVIQFQKSNIKELSEFEKLGSILGLERIQLLLDRLENPQDNLKYIHIAGTNGKGSVSRFVYSVLREAGYSVGIYTSPYLEVFNERIEVDDKYIDDKNLNRLLDRVTSIAREMENEGLPTPTEFDIVTATAFVYFYEMKVDFVVLEVGLGGRLDSTNIIKEPLVTAITSIGFDHTDRLGETLTEIASEKAGIIKSNSNCIVNIKDDTAWDTVEKIGNRQKASIYNIFSKHKKNIEGLSSIQCKTNKTGFKYKEREYNIKMLGRHQVENSILAIEIVEILKNNFKVSISDKSILRGLEKATNKGRFELILHKNKTIVLDGAHNLDGMKSFVNTMKELYNSSDDKFCIVLGFLEEKDYKDMIEELITLNADFFASQPSGDRSLSKDTLQSVLEARLDKKIKSLDLHHICNDFDRVFQEYDTVIFVGSLYMIGEARRILCKNEKIKNHKE